MPVGDVRSLTAPPRANRRAKPCGAGALARRVLVAISSLAPAACGADAGPTDPSVDPDTECQAELDCEDGTGGRGMPESTADDGETAMDWTRQFGTNGRDSASGVGVDANGNVYVSGVTSGAFAGEPRAGGGDAFLAKYDRLGAAAWTRQFGTTDDESATDLSVDANGNAYVVGFTNGSLSEQSTAGGWDAFVTKYDSSGALQWTRQFGTSEDDYGRGVSVDVGGNVYVSGTTEGTLAGQSSTGSGDAFVAKYDGSGSLQWIQQFGTDGNTLAQGLSVDASGNVYVSGNTNGTFPGQSSAGSGDGFIAKYDASGSAQWTRQFGTNDVDYCRSVSVDASGNVYASGTTSGTFPEQTSAGDEDAYITKYDASGAAQWTRQFGTNGGDSASGLGVDPSGNVYALTQTDGSWSGQSSAGGRDGAVAMYDASGELQWIRQFGTSADDFPTGLSVDASGNVHVSGATSGTFAGQASAGNSDAFLMRLIP